jgi:hypothetical protein
MSVEDRAAASSQYAHFSREMTFFMHYLGNSEWCWIALFLLLACTVLVGAPPALAGPPTGKTPWAIVLCQFTDQNYPPPPSVQLLSNFFTEAGKGTGGMFDFWDQASLGQISLSGTRLFGWYNLPSTESPAKYIGGTHRSEIWNLCVNTAQSQGADFSHFFGILVVPSPSTDDGALGGVVGRVVISPNGMTTMVWQGAITSLNYPAHEMGHGFGLDHSYDTQLRKCGPAAPGEYGDDYDIMSWTCSVKAGQGPFGATGPGLSAAYVNLFGWMPAQRVYMYDPAGPATEITLAALDTPQDPQYLVAKIPIGADPLHYYTVEYRHNRGLDSGLNDKIVLLHEIRAEHHGDEKLQYHPFLVDSNPDTLAPVSAEWTARIPGNASPSFVDQANNIHMTVVSTGETATINLGHSGDIPPDYPPPAMPVNLREGLSGISTLAYPGFIDINWDESTPGVEKSLVQVTGTLVNLTQSPVSTVLMSFLAEIPGSGEFRYTSQQIYQGTSWTFTVQACYHGNVCSPTSTTLTVTNPRGGGSSGSSGNGSGTVFRNCGRVGAGPCGVVCGGRKNPCPLPSKQ